MRYEVCILDDRCHLRMRSWNLGRLHVRRSSRVVQCRLAFPSDTDKADMSEGKAEDDRNEHLLCDAMTKLLWSTHFVCPIDIKDVEVEIESVKFPIQ
jgi:hypothetical protein